ncbi:MAG: ORC1-type DNA replication protein [Candidatus Aenigmatarchaeota archaeon]|nr:MAG: ORC1-type DNA replication protein [Candidatus Aenigmarchaeota archaeon]
MAQISLNEIFQNYVDNRVIFKEKDTLSIQFTPENIPHRDKQINQVGLILAPVLRGERPSNIFIYGKTGTGKSLCAKHTTSRLLETATNNGNENIRIVYVNCKMSKVSDTEYRMLSQLILNFGVRVPFTGLPTNQLYRKFYKILDAREQNVILVLDEIDALVNKIGDGVLYNLTRINQELKNAKLTIIGISNNISFINNLDPRVKSSLSEEEIVFPPYNANELRNILTERVGFAFNPDVVSPTVIAKCSALAAQEHGDARKALDLLRVAGEIAERMGNNRVSEEHVDFAEKKLDRDKTIEIIRNQPQQSKCVLLAILRLWKSRGKGIQTGDIYDRYVEICRKNNLKPLTQRRVSDLISELDMFGVVNAKVISRGRYGRTREIKIELSNEIIEKIERVFSTEFI